MTELLGYQLHVSALLGKEGTMPFKRAGSKRRKEPQATGDFGPLRYRHG